ncbi:MULTISPECIES: hypothetical protein [unclassified Undibacterium]|uniref:hypothetical protein n=1 Tax=unclassified Undibacterium TaxID=2630295 RepID=UPI002AC99E03|nr:MULTISPECIES: hypothetical protein [unclassified Undibacterium]MEB0141091.1 hypothetical protein [Undibacterium sp. CCC2.1]MEB0174104.1 hypothetical protein [Undibacterium sp. CCC1.1]MEB0178071.1 hypothetical protein [Undibacterium sp. CCC3.4]MEB0217264.1 hypothetical protein [Undibacterium sp. 5I2]WPX43767.1 hypothetical protein RHM61_00585 [Undibacterium sp. CCC3.4]
MKRRYFLGIALGSLGVPKLGTGTSLYGTPVSILPRPLTLPHEALRLSLSEANIPTGLWNDLSSLGSLWERILTDPEEKALFKRDPGSYLESRGIPRNILASQDQEVKMLTALCNDDVLSSAIQGDYKQFLSMLTSLGVVSARPPSALKERAIQALRGDATNTEYTRRLTTATDGAQFQKRLKQNELQYIYSQVAPNSDQAAVVAIPVAIAAIVVAYISVATSITVAILAGVYISVAVSVAITVGGGHSRNAGDQWPLFAGPPQSGVITAKTPQSARQMQTDREFAERVLIGKRMLALDPTRLVNAQETARIAKLLKQDAFVLEANRQLIRDEIDAFISAAEELNIIKIPSSTRTHVLDAMKQLSIRAAGLSTT